MHDGVVNETARRRRGRARSLAKFFAAGAMLSTVALLVPGWEDLHRAGIAVTVGVAGSASALLALLGGRTPLWLCHVCAAGGTVLVAACQMLAGGGSATASYALFYVWVALYAALFFSASATIAHIVVTAGAHVVALLVIGEGSLLAPQLAFTAGTQVAAWLVVGGLTRQLRRQADTDVLTGLPNRRGIDVALDVAAESARRADHPVCVATLDLDGFKAVNDREGHDAGDRILIDVASSWRRVLRAGDLLARVGGDEFVLLLPACDLDEGEEIVRRLVAVTPASVTCSAGLAQWDGTETSRQLVMRADTALYAAKRHGPATVSFAPVLPA